MYRTNKANAMTTLDLQIAIFKITDYKTFLQVKKAVNDFCDLKEKEFKKIENSLTKDIEIVGGLVPDSIRNNKEYRDARIEFKRSFEMLRHFNSHKSLKKFQKEYNKEMYNTRIKL